MAITLNPDQERAIQEAIRAGVVRSVDQFIDAAIEALPRRYPGGFDQQKARQAGSRIRELRKGVRLDRRGISIREFAHSGHKY